MIDDIGSTREEQDFESGWREVPAPPGDDLSIDAASRAIVPPMGALPRRFGASPTSLWIGRILTVGAPVAAVLIVAVLVFAPDEAPEWSLDLVKGAAVPLLLFIVSRLFRGRIRPPRAVVFEPAGVRVIHDLRVDAFGWGELVAIAPPVTGGTIWTLVARRGAEERRVLLDVSKSWMDRLVRELTGESRPEAGMPS